jgi:hypothetical protein
MDIEEPCCIVSIDKDLLQIPGMHFNFVRGTLYLINELDGLRCFYRQILTGDLPTDNIPGIYGLGSKTASKMIDHLTTERSMFETCLEAYKKTFKESAEKLLDRNAQLLYIRTREGRGWVVPSGV